MQDVLGPRDELAMQAGVPAGMTFGRARGPAFGARRAPIIKSAEPHPAPAPKPSLRDHPHPLARRWDAWCRKAEAWAARHLPSPDLAEDVGSARWFRELAMLVALVVIALVLWPSAAPLEAAPLPPLTDAARAEFRAQTLQPWTDGATQGRHFAANTMVARLDNAPERPTIQLTAMLGENDSLPRMLQRAGIGAGDAGQVAAMVQQAMPLDQIPSGTRFAITLGQRSGPSVPRPLDAISFRPRFDLALDIRRNGGGLSLARTAIPVDTTPLRIRGIVGASLYRSARAAGAPPETVQDYLRAIDQALPFEEIAPTDEFDLVVQYRRAADGQGQAGDLLYAGIVRGGQPQVQMLRWGQDGGFETLADMTGAGQAQESALGAPVAGRITSLFGMRRHPILGFVRMHAGIDFGAAWGSPVYAVTDGTVSYAGWHGGHGNYVRLEHGGGIASGYGHLSRIAVSPGSGVRRGQVIGYVGSTGLSTGPHLHYEVYRGGRVVDPMSVRFLAQRRAVDPGQIAAFKARLQALTSLRTGTLAR
ncbi:peptidoglycan DD-metalloendopeptidase family protein [Novosphingobium cyanobacteriorum]|uniref:M23 family metallopeptidase n=1 Tax=Novosphingobium cyanobacteriorum TaxID=3024215 RepID=A0ABT6CHH9_9SPHN|nr:M23 family metallopeptidase [Novosphingobium cyanobacteriorum]MDF8332948.1 M23 family metallopeptidase [Novosphingobium cyanobacteriorum]